jgi:uncharacterized protein (UPF0210 family)
MKIRSITVFVNPGFPPDERILEQAGEFVQVARPAFEAAGYEVQTARLATTTFTQLLPALQPDLLIELAQQMEQSILSLGFEYLSLGPALCELPASYDLIPPAIAATRNVFFSGHLTSQHGVSLPAVRACARIIHQASQLSPDGFANLRFAALANVLPGAPFFPAAYHQGDGFVFALATESADLVVDVLSASTGLEEARRILVQTIEQHAQQLEQVARSLESAGGPLFGGIDFTLAPFPSPSQSFGTAMEQLGAPAAGQHGSLAAAAILADTLDQARFLRAGFNGLMLPVLEDSILAQRAAEGLLSVKDLLLFSAVCGTGLDTLPLPGDASQEQLGALLLDLAALSQRLGKPLTARLMPIPGKQAGDPTGFDFAFFANSRVLALQASPLHGRLAGQETFALTPRQKN